MTTGPGPLVGCTKSVPKPMPEAIQPMVGSAEKLGMGVRAAPVVGRGAERAAMRLANASTDGGILFMGSLARFVGAERIAFFLRAGFAGEARSGSRERVSLRSGGLRAVCAVELCAGKKRFKFARLELLRPRNRNFLPGQSLP